MEQETAAVEQTVEEVVEQETTTETSNEVEVNEEENLEFTDTEPKEEQQVQEEKKQPKGSKNAYYAEMRRKYEQQKNQEGKNESDYNKGIIAGTKGINPYTNKPIKDQRDIEEFLRMQKLESEGKDPVGDYLEAIKEEYREKERKEKSIKEEQQKREQEIFNEFAEFEKKYGKETLENLSKDKDFAEFADRFKNSASYLTIYDMYINQKNMIEKKANELAAEKIGRMRSSSIPNNQGEITKKSFNDMSDEEFLQHKLLNKQK